MGRKETYVEDIKNTEDYIFYFIMCAYCVYVLVGIFKILFVKVV